MKTETFKILSEFIKKRSGIVIVEEKIYLLESRLDKVCGDHNLANLDELALKIKTSPLSAIASDVIEAMTTNETYFYRDSTPFVDFEKKILPELIELKGTRKAINVLSAACSSGQEPYTLSMIFEENKTLLQGWRTDITAFDLSNDILDIAKEGVYTQFEVQRGLPVNLLVKYFDQNNKGWRVKDEVKKHVTFKQQNLLEPLNFIQKFDVVFLRNVLIYFDVETKTKILSEIRKKLVPEGYLFLGSSETIIGITDEFKAVEGMRGIYKAK